MSDEMSTAAIFVMASAVIVSIGALLFLFERHIRGEPLLAYQPRQRVPWRSGIVLAVMLLIFSGVIFAFTSSGDISHPLAGIDSEKQHEASEDAEIDEPNSHNESADSIVRENSAAEFIRDSLATTVFFVLLILVLAAWLNLSVGANPSDLGLPASGAQAVRDFGIGIVACAASLLPIYLVQLGLTIVIQPEIEHPIVEQLSKSHTPAMLMAGFLLVVVAAPLGEEFVFRMLLQGWLERWEDETIGFSKSERHSTGESHLINDATPLALDVVAQVPDDDQQVVLQVEPPHLPSHGLLSTLPHGWVPILISGTLFGLAHLGHGVSPVPLVLFGIVLGYVYQRTHRLVPSITAHALFNAYSMTMLWLQLGD